jgi:hypothetical protein
MPAFLRSEFPHSLKNPERCDYSPETQKKVCYACGRGFNKRLGRSKALPVAGGWHVCAACVDDRDR